MPKLKFGTSPGLATSLGARVTQQHPWPTPTPAPPRQANPSVSRKPCAGSARAKTPPSSTTEPGGWAGCAASTRRQCPYCNKPCANAGPGIAGPAWRRTQWLAMPPAPSANWPQQRKRPSPTCSTPCRMPTTDYGKRQLEPWANSQQRQPSRLSARSLLAASLLPAPSRPTAPAWWNPAKPSWRPWATSVSTSRGCWPW